MNKKEEREFREWREKYDQIAKDIEFVRDPQDEKLEKCMVIVTDVIVAGLYILAYGPLLLFIVNEMLK